MPPSRSLLTPPPSQEASQLLPDSPYVWHLAMAAGGVCGDPGLLSFAFDRVCVVDGVNAHGGVGITTSLLHALANACVAPGGPPSVLASAVHRMVVAPALWAQLAKRLLLSGLSEGNASRIKLAGVCAGTAIAQRASGGVCVDTDADIVACVCEGVLRGGGGVKARVVRLVHQWPQSGYAWTLLAHAGRAATL